jgi:hypothetical protein
MRGNCVVCGEGVYTTTSFFELKDPKTGVTLRVCHDGCYGRLPPRAS